jgi:aryl-alcohol dehydrogenase-like predicted oxidoreductase|tara:strand:- start:249 stop:1118 length:870 start_codon:yes stop_codon:yes gene_type:complete
MERKLILGTVQFGIDYGVNNSIGKLEENQVLELFKIAHNQGVRILDTAEVYGNAHEIIGNFHKKNDDSRFKIITKFPHSVKYNSINNKVLQYLEQLAVSSIEVLMFHSFESFKTNYKALDSLKELKSKGSIKNIGVSVYTNEHLKQLLNEDLITVIQFPFNMLDNFNVRGDLLDQLKQKGKSIHTRSAFLQGLFFKNTNDKSPIVQNLKTELKILNQIIIDSNCSMEELALSYCLHQENIDNVIIGVDSILQLNANIKASSYNISQDDIKVINNIQVKDLDLLNPSLWK